MGHDAWTSRLGASSANAVVALVISRLLTGWRRPEQIQEARAELAAAAPRTSVVLGALFSLDTLRPVVMADGTTLVTLSVGIHSDQLKGRMPAFGDFVHKYIDPARARFILTDKSGAPFLEAQGHDRSLTVRLRSQHGHLIPLNGQPRPKPDTLGVIADFTTKAKVWHVGFHDLDMEFVNGTHPDGVHDWSFLARKEPQWNLPLITARCCSARRCAEPFAGEGSMFRIGLREGTADEPTVLLRQSRLTVQESAILKFINSLTSAAMDDFGARVEHEENQWLHDLFVAMQADAHAALAP